jgi:hypothetical protein
MNMQPLHSWFFLWMKLIGSLAITSFILAPSVCAEQYGPPRVISFDRAFSSASIPVPFTFTTTTQDWWYERGDLVDFVVRSAVFNFVGTKEDINSAITKIQEFTQGLSYTPTKVMELAMQALKIDPSNTVGYWIYDPTLKFSNKFTRGELQSLLIRALLRNIVIKNGLLSQSVCMYWLNNPLVNTCVCVSFWTGDWYICDF